MGAKVATSSSSPVAASSPVHLHVLAPVHPRSGGRVGQRALRGMTDLGDLGPEDYTPRFGLPTGIASDAFWGDLGPDDYIPRFGLPTGISGAACFKRLSPRTHYLSPPDVCRMYV